MSCVHIEVLDVGREREDNRIRVGSVLHDLPQTHRVHAVS